MFTRTQTGDLRSLENLALILRIGLGAVFVIGGISKLDQLLDPAKEAAMVATYLGPHGYINAFFADYLFAGDLGPWFGPWGFLAALSTFELVSGLALIAGLLVRPLALVYGFLLWSFVIALPVATAPGAAAAVDTYTAPAVLVQIRDITLSGMMFVLFNLGSGRFSLDERLFGSESTAAKADWESLGLLLRLSIAATFVVAGAFAGLGGIQDFGLASVILVAIGVSLATGVGARLAALVLILAMVWFIARKIDLDRSLIANLNGFKRELAFIAGGLVLTLKGAGNRFTIADLATRMELARCLLLLRQFGRRCIPDFGKHSH